ncbi:Retrovirus-related Pol polyprotein from transposon TNT 1-94 [Vitis vinifera]|uniref:Retrovirus-related Pol polyprotein from transposon TNT 1-94 n=1 Tax=Vitis vinifera TaxID=29760 RepID=A0A438CP06_VITVI|nr:Retrovirus-related Pol polyprotein from transposon TNT 1-94 [Vitis vinifera]
MVQNQFNSKIQVLKSDNAKEYFTSSLSTYLQNHGIIHISSCVDTPQQNGVAERKNRHLLEVARCLMFSSNVPNYFWGEAILTATYLINRMPSKVLTFQSPRQFLLKKFPHTRAASSDLPLKVFGCTAFVHVYPQNRSKFAPRANKGIFLGYSPTKKGTNAILQPTKDLHHHGRLFLQTCLLLSQSHVQGESMNEHQEEERQELEHGSQPTCGQYLDSISSLPEENIGEDRAGEVLIPSIDDSTLPIALRKGVRKCTDHPIGNYVTYEGLSPSYRAFATSLDDTQVPNTIQEAFKISEWKKAVQDEIDALEKNGSWDYHRFAGWEKARGDSSLIGCQSRLVLATTGHKKCVLNGDLEEEVYMEIPPGFKGSMAKNQADHTLFVKKSHAGKMAILIVYVDDIILSGNDMEELQNLKKYLSEEFEVKDLGNLKYFLGMEVARSRKGIKKLGIEKDSTPVDRGRYQRLVGRLIYLSHTRPDIGFVVSTVSQFMHSPTEEHMEAVYRILRYLKMTPRKGLFFKKTENRDTEVYLDADWAGNIIDRRSTSGYYSFVWGNLVTWRSKKQSVVARSSAEAEYRALGQGISISIAKNPVHHDRTKHVEIDRHFITEKEFRNSSEYNKDSFGMLKERKKCILSEIANIDAVEQEGVLSLELSAQRALRKGELEELILREEVHWRQKAKVGFPFTEEEISKAIFQLDRDKASGPDGFIITGFQDCWDVIKEDLVNLDKSELFGINLDQDHLSRLALMLDCKASNWPILYLGLPLGGNPKACGFWDPVIKRISRRLDGWQKAYLSFGGRITLIHSCLSHIPNYFLSLFKIPASMAAKIERLQRDFLWSGVGNVKDIVLLVGM